MQQDKNKIELFKNTFEHCVNLGFNPYVACMTVANFSNSEYLRYVKSRLSVIKRGEDLVYRFKEVVNFVIEKIK